MISLLAAETEPSLARAEQLLLEEPSAPHAVVDQDISNQRDHLAVRGGLRIPAIADRDSD